MIESELQERLKNWAREYGGGRYEHISWNGRNLLQVLIDHKGEVPDARGYVPVPIKTAADDVEEIVKTMQNGGRFRIAMVLRCEFYNLDAPIEHKLTKLGDLGLPMSRSGYYAYLSQAVAYVDGALDALRAANDPFRHVKEQDGACV
jgi:hypothetical protein